MSQTEAGFPADLVSAVIKAYDVRGLVGEQITSDFVQAVGAAFVEALDLREAGSVVIGHDMRDSSPRFADAFAKGVTEHGVDVVMIGLCSTDGLYFASGRLDMPGAMFTASHNPAAYNGIKLCRAGPLRSDRTVDWQTLRTWSCAGYPAMTARAAASPSARCSRSTPTIC